MERTRRWIELLRLVLPDRPELVDAVKRDDGRQIVDLLQRYEAKVQEELNDFRRSHPQLDAKSRRLRRLDRDEDDSDDLDWDAWWDKRRDATLELQDDPELEWYLAEMEQRRSEVWRWRRRVESAKEVAGIGTVPADPDEADS
jgi:hypothetical protein